MSLYDTQLGEEVNAEEFGDMKEIFTGKIQLTKITYTFQDEEGVTAHFSLKHKDYRGDDEDD